MSENKVTVGLDRAAGEATELGTLYMPRSTLSELGESVEALFGGGV